MVMICSEHSRHVTRVRHVASRGVCSDKGGESRQRGSGPRLIVHHQLGPVETDNCAVTVLESRFASVNEIKERTQILIVLPDLRTL